MRGFLLGVVGSLVLLVVAALVLPSFIDWNRYRDRLAAEVEALTGRALTVEGDLALSLVPTPAFSAERVSLANRPGGSDPIMARIEAVRIDLALLPLLTGQIAVRSVEIIRPDILLEQGADGRGNWMLWPGQENTGAKADQPSDGNGDSDGDGTGNLSISLDNLRITDGRLRYRPTAAEGADRPTLTLSAIDLTLTADSLSGPFTAKGSARYQDRGVTIQVGLGRVSAEGATQLAAQIGLAQSGALMEFSGIMAGLSTTPTLRGSLAATASDLAAAATDLAPILGLTPDALPPLPPGAVDLDATAFLADGRAGLEGLSLHLGDSEASGEVSVTLARPHDLTAALTVSRLDLDAWHSAAAGEGTEETAPATPTQKPGGTDGSGLAALEGLELPTDLSATVTAEVEAILTKGSALRDLRLEASLAGGVLTLEGLSVRLPGVSDLSLRGQVATPQGQPEIEASLEGASGNLRALLDWLAVDVGAVPGERLRSLQFKANLAATPERVKVTGLDMTLDTSRLRGALTLRPGPRLGLGVTAVLDTLNLDAYLPPETPASDPTPDDPAGPSPTTGDPPLLAGLEALNDIDASFDLSVGRLSARGETLEDLSLKGSLVKGALSVDSGGYGLGPGGTRLALSGGLSGFGGDPRFAGLTANFAVPDIRRLARALRLALPPAVADLGAMELSTTLTGPLTDLEIDSRNTLAGGDLWAAGRVIDAPSGRPRVDLAIDLAHPDFAALAGRIAPGYRPRANPGPLRLQAQVAGTPESLRLSGLETALGNSRIAGTLSLSLADLLPVIEADLSAGLLDLDALRPADQTAEGWRGGGRSFGATDPSPLLRRVAAGRQAAGLMGLSTDPLDLSALDLMRADLSLTAQTLVLAGLRLEDADMKAQIANGSLEVPSLSARLFGGALSGTGRLRRGGRDGSPNALTLSASLTEADVTRTLAGLDSDGTGSGGGGLGGRASLALDVSARGASPAAMARSLSGDGTARVAALTVAGDGPQQGLGVLLGLAGRLNQAIGGLPGLGGGKTARETTLDAAFTLNQGVVQLDPLTLVSPLYRGRMTGALDLVEGRVAAEGVADLAEGALSDLLGQVVSLPDRLPFSIEGSLDNPVVRIATPRLPGLRPEDGAGAAGAAAGAVQGILDGLRPGRRDREDSAPAPEASGDTNSGTAEDSPRRRPRLRDLVPGN